MQEPQPIRYLALGDSLTEGVGADHPAQCAVSQFFDFLKHSTKCQLKNFGISGTTSSELLSLLEHPAITRMLPQMNLISITTGGCDFIEIYEKNQVSLKSILKTCRQIQTNVKSILSIIRGYNPSATVHLLGFYLPLPAYELGFRTANFFVQSMNRTYKQISQTFGVQFVDPYECFLHRQDYFADEVHPNQKGHDRLAKLWIDCHVESAPSCLSSAVKSTWH